MIRPGKGMLLVKLLPYPKEESPLIRLEKSRTLLAAQVLAVGRGVYDSVRVNEVVIFHRGQLVIGRAPVQLAAHLKNTLEEELFLLRWYDVLFVLEKSGETVVDEVRWTWTTSLPRRDSCPQDWDRQGLRSSSWTSSRGCACRASKCRRRGS